MYTQGHGSGVEEDKTSGIAGGIGPVDFYSDKLLKVDQK